MATTYKNGKLAAPAADVTSYGTVYNTGASVTAVISSIIVCNTSASNVLYRIGIDVGAAGTPLAANGEFIAYDATIAANDTVSLSLGLTLGANEYIRCSAASTAINFIACVAEISA